MIGSLSSNIPSGPLDQKWEKHKFESRIISPANKRKYSLGYSGALRRFPFAARKLAKSVAFTALPKARKLTAAD